SMTVITAEDIRNRQAMFLSDLLRTVPGFAVSQSGGPGAQTQVRVRGSEANHVLVLVDGMRVNDPASADEFQFQYMLSEQIERIEILRGPQSATWGTDALSAVINIIHRKSADRSRATATAELGSWNSRKLSASGEHADGRYRAWAGLSGFETDGINASSTGTERDGNRNTAVNAGLDVDYSDSIQLGFSARRLEAESEFDDFDFTTGLPADADRLSEASRTYLQGTLRFAPRQSRWSGHVAVKSMHSDNQNYADGRWSGSTASDSLEFAAQATAWLGDTDQRQHRVTLAAERQEIEFQQRGIAAVFGDPNQDQEYDINGVAVEYFSRPFEGFNWNASARLDDFSDFDSAQTWQLAASYRVNDRLRLRGSGGTGTKAPTFTERFGFFEGSFRGNPGLEPEQSTGWELGLESEMRDGAARLGVAWFEQDLENEIDGFVFDPGSGLFTAVNKSLDSRRRGLEITLDMSLSEALDLAVNYTYTDATQPLAGGLEQVEIRRPEHLANLKLDYRFGDGRGRLNFALRFNGHQFDSFFSPVTFMAEQVELGDYWLADLATAWQLRPGAELNVRVENLLDERYQEVLGFARAGRAVYAGLRMTFGASSR
ncbi:MAG: TonB-dependent receptor, partial [Xanthomonadales bacterium]|nr:TonB-dependent receptor [Xanthomonadales bacterium]